MCLQHKSVTLKQCFSNVVPVSLRVVQFNILVFSTVVNCCKTSHKKKAINTITPAVSRRPASNILMKKRQTQFVVEMQQLKTRRKKWYTYLCLASFSVTTDEMKRKDVKWVLRHPFLESSSTSFKVKADETLMTDLLWVAPHSLCPGARCGRLWPFCQTRSRAARHLERSTASELPSARPGDCRVGSWLAPPRKMHPTHGRGCHGYCWLDWRRGGQNK